MKNIIPLKARRYEALKKYVGIRKDLVCEKYEAYKTINGKRYSSQFASLLEAIKWRNEFVPDEKTHGAAIEANNLLPLKTAVEANMEASRDEKFNFPDEWNGRDRKILFAEVWDRYQKIHFPTLATSTKAKLLERSRIFEPFKNKKMGFLSAEYFDSFIEQQKRFVLAGSDLRRSSFRAELKILITILNWYRENYDRFFFMPILKRHFTMGIIRKIEKAKKKMSPENLIRFFKALPPFWRDVAEFQFYIAGRIGEVCGLQKGSIDFERNTVLIENSAVFNHTGNKHIIELKLPKNGEVRILEMTEGMREILARRIQNSPKDCSFVFNLSGKSLTYRQCQCHYNKGLRRVGLYKQGYRSTHFIRHSTATITRGLFDNIDYAAAISGHKDLKVLQQYAALDVKKVQSDASKKLEEYMFGLENKIAKK
ncbi:MAG: tyrosine-type recombinase/integrase [Oligoflexia bacterium]|nr:tyrosine-type recombinase/integrase [Oligoflexia bacterium]